MPKPCRERVFRARNRQQRRNPATSLDGKITPACHLRSILHHMATSFAIGYIYMTRVCVCGARSRDDVRARDPDT